jgi:hypothetical protein
MKSLSPRTQFSRLMFLVDGYVFSPNSHDRYLTVTQFFMWMTPLMRKGAQDYVTENDLPSLKVEDESARLGERLELALRKK